MNYKSSITIFTNIYTTEMAEWVKSLNNAYTTLSSFVVRIDFESDSDLLAFRLKFMIPQIGL